MAWAWEREVIYQDRESEKEFVCVIEKIERKKEKSAKESGKNLQCQRMEGRQCQARPGPDAALTCSLP